MFKQLLKPVFLYLLGFVLAYPVNIFIGFFAKASIHWLISLSLCMALSGIVLWLLMHRHSISFRGFSFKKIRHEYFRDLGVQFFVVCVLLVLVIIKEYNRWFYPLSGIYEYFQRMTGDNELASRLSYNGLPMISLAYFVMISFLWICYNLAQLLFDKRIRKQ